MCSIFTLIHVWHSHSIELSLNLLEYKHYKYSNIYLLSITIWLDYKLLNNCLTSGKLKYLLYNGITSYFKTLCIFSCYRDNVGKRFLKLLAKICRSVCFFYNFIEISTNYNYIASFYNNFKKKKRISICGQILNVSRRNRTKNII